MGLFNRNRRAPGADVHAISAFWDWWSHEGRAIDPRRTSKTAEELTRRVAAIHPDLTWHFGAGATSEHRLTVSGGGVAEIRPAAERWLRASPAPDATWEYRASQEADPESLTSTLSIAGHEVDLSLTRFRVEPFEEELRVHVGVYHPAFGTMPVDVSAQVSYLLLDWLLGEDDVERWLGHVEPLTVAPASASSAAQLTAAVGALARSLEPDQWTMASWQDKDGLPGLATFRRGVRWIDHPTLDKHHVLIRGFRPQDNGLPADSSTLDGLRDIELALEAALGPRGLLLGHETHAGKRTFHVYADGEDQNADAALREFASGHDLALTSRPDPAWSEVRHFTG